MSEQATKIKSPVRDEAQITASSTLDHNLLYRFPLPLPLAMQGAHQRLLGASFPIGPSPYGLPYSGSYIKKESVRKGKWTVM